MPALDNPKYEEFAQAYVALKYNAEAAVRAAGINDNAENLLCYRGVLARVKELQRPLLRRYQITADRTMMGLARVAYVDPRRMIDPETGGLLPIDQMDEDVAGAIKGFKVRTEYENDGYEIDLATGLPDKNRPKRIRVVTTEIKLNDRVPALTVLAKHFKLVNDEGDGLNALANVLSDRLQAARRRRAPAVDVIENTPRPREVNHARIDNADVQAEPAQPGLSEAVPAAGSGQG
jgi:phage terminase small subunit